MTPANRPDSPKFLEENGPKWGEEYAAKRRENPSYRFQWKTWQGAPVNQRLMPLLIEMTDDRCAFCDWFPMDCGTVRTIDHFKPKATFPKEVYAWSNLYLACPQCQNRRTAHLTEADFALLLRPDEDGYTFERYFIYNHRNGEIEPYPAATPEDRKRAERTIDVFQLNAWGRPASRKRVLNKIDKSQFDHLRESEKAVVRQDQPFRYLLT